MSRVPLNSHNVTSLEEDLRVLNLLPADARPLSEDKSGKSKKMDDEDDEDDEDDYDYGDEMADESFDFVKGPAKIKEAARSVMNAFNSLSEDEIDELDDSYIEAVQNAAEVLGIDLDLGEDKLSNTEINQRTRAGNKNDPEAVARRKAAKKERTKNHAAKQQRRAAWARSAAGKASIARSRKRSVQQRDDGNIDNIIERLRGLTTPLTQQSREVGAISDRIVEGLKSLHMDALKVSTSIAEELAEDDFDKSDPRYSLGVWFEGIRDDAEGLLNRIFEHGDVPMEDAIEDLQALTSDFKKGLAKANRIA